MLKTLKLSHRLALLIAVVSCGFFLFSLQSYITISSIQVKGPIYDKIIQDKDLVADILPPPIYIIESYLLTIKLATTTEQQQQDLLAQQLNDHYKNYLARIAYWKKQQLAPRVKEELISTAYLSALEFYDKALNRLLPAVKIGDKPTVSVIANELSQTYERHRQSIDHLVEILNAENLIAERQADTEINSAMVALVLVWGFCLLAGVTVSYGILAKLREREAFINAVVSEAADGIITTDIDGHITSFNRAAEEIFGYLESEVHGKNINLLIPINFHSNTHPDRFDSAKIHTKEDDGIDRETKGLRNGGEEFPLELAVSEISKEGDRCFAGIVRDISYRKKAELALRNSEERFQLAMQGADDGLWDWELVNNTVYYSPRWKSMLGFTESEIADTTKEWQQRIHPQDVDHAMKELNRHLDGLTEQFHCEYRIKHKNGYYIWVLSRAIATRDKHGKANRVVGIHTDITERKQVEHLKSEFISTVSHELRTPLTAIRGAIGLLQANVADELSLKTKTLIDIAHRNTDHLLGLVNDMLDMEKIQSGILEMQFETIELQSLIRNAVEINQAVAEHFNVQFETEFTSTPILIRADANRIMQVVTNLLSNAAKFSKTNTSVKISVTKPQPHTVRLSIADQGIGIPKHFHKKIFEKFTQVDSSDIRHKGGTGLGLSITKTLVEEMHGTISFETEVDVGTTFHVDFPAAVNQQP